MATPPSLLPRPADVFEALLREHVAVELHRELAAEPLEREQPLAALPQSAHVLRDEELEHLRGG